MIIHYIVEKKHFCRYGLQAFSTEEILKRHIKHWFKINSKKTLRCLRKVNRLDLKNINGK